jgi:hypothetical protein
MVCRDGGSLVIEAAEDHPQSSDWKNGVDTTRPFEISSYLDLLQLPRIPTSRKDIPSGKRNISTPIVDAIIVPTFRSAEQVKSAVDLASQARCDLLLLYTDDFPPELHTVLEGLEQGRAIPLALRSGQRNPHLLDLGADLPQSFASAAALDISRKRNLGVLIGRMRGWTRMLLLDDDIRKLTIEKLSAAAALLDKYPVVGLQVHRYPDASVVGHARRRNGRRQEPFVSGGSLLIDPQRLDGFFPAIYHEDWLCTINHLRAGEVAIGGIVGQKAYKPFASADRAKNEEFGDILALGLLWLVYTRRKTSAPSIEGDAVYWREATNLGFWVELLQERALLLKDIAERLKARYPDDLPAQRALEVARHRCGELAADEFVAVMKKWISNLDLWRDRVSRLPRVESVEKALAELGILNIVQQYHGVSPQSLADRARQRQVKFFALGSAAVILGGLLGSVLRIFRQREDESALSPGHDRDSWLRRIQAGRRTGGGLHCPPAVGNQGQHHDGYSAACQQEPAGVTGRDEPGPERAVQVRG